ncbi:hypothetical protein LguiB_033026 [Lonicera macranthoides]
MALLFNSILSCFRCRRNRSPDHPTSPPSSNLLPTIPIIIYGSTLASDNCSICLGEFVHGQEVRVLPKCSHVFHRVCIDQWLPLRSLHCPVCRDRVIQEDIVDKSNVNAENGAAVRTRRNCRNNRNGNGTAAVSPSASLALTFNVGGNLRFF